MVSKSGLTRIVLSWRKIVMNYLTGFFLLDFVSSVPISLMFSNLASFNKLLRIVKIPRFFKIFKFMDFLVTDKLLYLIRINGNSIKALILFLVTIIMLHLSTCIWVFLGLYDTDANTSWVYRYKLQDQPYYIVYFTGFYFMFCTLTTVGYGDITPKDDGTGFSPSRDHLLYPLDVARSRVLLHHDRYSVCHLH